MLMIRAEQRLKSGGDGSMGDPFIPEVDVNVQDQATDTVILPLAQTLGTTALAVLAVIEEYTIDVDSVAAMSVGDHIRIFDIDSDRYYAGTALSILGTVVTLDTPLDYAYPVDSEVTINNINMAVDGSVTPVHFHLRTGTPSIPSSIDITRMIMVCETSTAVDLNKFGDLPALTRGIVFRSSNGHIRNIFNVKANKGLVGLAYDWTPFEASNPSSGINGFSWRLTFGGQEKIGVVLRVLQDGQLGIIVQDDLTGLVSLTCVVEGHVVDD